MAEEKTEITPNRLLVLDANILLRAVLGTRVRKLITHYAEEVPLFAPVSCVAEVNEYLPNLCVKRNWDVAASMDLFNSLLTLIKVVEEGFYIDFEEQAKQRISKRDVDDWPVVALALLLGAPVWTEDPDFFGSGIATWTTETVELYLRDGPLQINEPTFLYVAVG